MKFWEYKLLEFDNFSLSVGTLLKAAAIIIITWVIVFLISRFISRVFKNRQLDEGRKQSVIQLIKYFLWIIGIIYMLDSVGIEITILLAGSAALLVGLGLGLQQIFQDLVSGVFILVEGAIRVNDIIEIDGLVGRILSIHLRTSRVLTRDGIVIIVPNHKFIDDNIINWSNHLVSTRFKVSVGVAYGSDVDLVRKILVACAFDHPDCITSDTMKDKHPFARFVDFGESSLDFELYFWSTNIFMIENTKSDLRFMINEKFKEHGVTIPFPQRDVHIKDK